MNFDVVWAIARKDLRVFFADRKSLITTLGVPILLASFMAWIFGSLGGSDGKINPVDVLWVDQDNSVLSHAVADSLTKNGMVTLTPMDEAPATDRVRTGKAGIALVLPAGFGKNAPSAMFSGIDLPNIRILRDPSKSMETQVVRGALMQSAMQEVSKQAFSASGWRDTMSDNLARVDASTGMSAANKTALHDLFASVDRFQKLQSADDPPAPPSSTTAPAKSERSEGGSPGMRLPFSVSDEAITAKVADPNASYAGGVHSFVGMAMQGLLFFAIEAAMTVLRATNRGVWRRLRAAPLSRFELLGGRTVSSMMISLLILTSVLTVGALFFHVRITGSVPGFILVGLSTALMVSTLGLLIACLGRNEGQARGISIFVALMLSMLGGAWMPTMLMPPFLQPISKMLPSRWAIDGLDAMTWRGSDFSHAVLPVTVLLGFTVVFAAIAVARFRWDAD